MRRRTLSAGAAALLLILALSLAAGCTQEPQPKPGDGTPITEAPGGPAVTVSLSAAGISFDREAITVPAGASVTIAFANNDAVNHNLAVYRTAAATEVIFQGEIISKGKIGYRFVAPSEPGKYFFRCDVHPSFMSGDFIVTEASTSE